MVKETEVKNYTKIKPFFFTLVPMAIVVVIFSPATCSPAWNRKRQRTLFSVSSSIFSISSSFSSISSLRIEELTDLSLSSDEKGVDNRRQNKLIFGGCDL